MQCCAIWCIGVVSSALLRRDETGDTFATLCERWLETGDAIKNDEGLVWVYFAGRGVG